MLLLKRAEGLFERLEDLGMLACGLCLFAIMVIVMSDVTMRYVFNSPFPWSYDFISMYLMVAAFFLALARTFREGGHITIDFFVRFMTPKVRRITAFIVDIGMMPVLAIMIVTSFNATVVALVGQEVLGSYFKWPVWLSNVFVPLGMGLLFVRVLLHLIGLIVGTQTGLPGDNSDTPQDDVL